MDRMDSSSMDSRKPAKGGKAKKAKKPSTPTRAARKPAQRAKKVRDTLAAIRDSGKPVTYQTVTEFMGPFKAGDEQAHGDYLAVCDALETAAGKDEKKNPHPSLSKKALDKAIKNPPPANVERHPDFKVIPTMGTRGE